MAFVTELLYIYDTFMHQSFVTNAPPPPPTGMGRANVQGSGSDLEFARSTGLVILHKHTPVEFTIIRSRIMTRSRSPQYRAFSWGVMDEKSLSSLFPMGVRGGQWLQMTGALSFN